MRRILCFISILGTITTHTDNSVPASVQFVPVGWTVMVPCEGYGNHSDAKWLYRREDSEKNSETIFRERKGIHFHGSKRIRIKIMRDFKLEIRPFTEEDRGIYVCELCTNTLSCTKSKPVSLIPQSETASPSLKTHFIIEGGTFNHSCLHNDTLKVGWTFEGQGESTVTHVNSLLTDRGLLSILNVQPSHSGKYRCWRETLTGQWENVYLLTLCVLTVSDDMICTLYCDVDVDAERDPITVVTDKGNVSVTGTINTLKSSVICSDDMEMNRTSLEERNNTRSGAIEDSNPSHMAVPISICAVAFLITAALLVILCSSRQSGTADTIFCRDCHSMTRRSLQDENETDVIYSTLELRSHPKHSVITYDHECVYSQIKM